MEPNPGPDNGERQAGEGRCIYCTHVYTCVYTGIFTAACIWMQNRRQVTLSVTSSIVTRCLGPYDLSDVLSACHIHCQTQVVLHWTWTGYGDRLLHQRPSERNTSVIFELLHTQALRKAEEYLSSSHMGWPCPGIVECTCWRERLAKDIRKQYCHSNREQGKRGSNKTRIACM